MTDLKRVEELRRSYEMSRRKGDALRTRGRDEAASEAYEYGLQSLDEALRELGVSVTEPRDHDHDSHAMVDPAIHGPNGPGQDAWVSEAVEVLGARGGLLRRLDDNPAAISSYRAGAELERKYDLPSTYNRMNYIKVSLIAGAETLDGLDERLRELNRDVEHRLATDERAADDAWIWADSGDTLLLLNRVDEAAAAYQRFRKKAETGSTRTTLAVLREISGALTDREPPDPAARRFRAAVEAVQPVLEAG